MGAMVGALFTVSASGFLVVVNGLFALLPVALIFTVFEVLLLFTGELPPHPAKGIDAAKITMMEKVLRIFVPL
jgi:hypothetical protein